MGGGVMRTNDLPGWALLQTSLPRGEAGVSAGVELVEPMLGLIDEAIESGLAGATGDRHDVALGVDEHLEWRVGFLGAESEAAGCACQVDRYVAAGFRR